jgi:serine/threonine protein kinase
VSVDSDTETEPEESIDIATGPEKLSEIINTQYDDIDNNIKTVIKSTITPNLCETLRNIKNDSKIDYFEEMGGQSSIKKVIHAGKTYLFKYPKPGPGHIKEAENICESVKKMRAINKDGPQTQCVSCFYNNESSFIFIEEKIKGITLKKYIEQAKEQNSTPTDDEKRKMHLIICKIFILLDILHNNNVYHNDVKPDNIMLKNSDTKNPIPLLIDFGLLTQNLPRNSEYEIQDDTKSTLTVPILDMVQLMSRINDYYDSTDNKGIFRVYKKEMSQYPLFGNSGRAPPIDSAHYEKVTTTYADIIKYCMSEIRGSDEIQSGGMRYKINKLKYMIISYKI